MTIWLDALDQAACGDLAGAVERVRELIPAVLRRYVDFDGSRAYAGPIVEAIGRFRAKCGPDEQGRLRLYELELVDAVVEDVVAEVIRTLGLVELCRLDPPMSLEEIVACYAFPSGLKRDGAWRRARVADLLRSMLAEGIPVPEHVAELLGEAGAARFEFNELAAAAAPMRIELTWRTLVRRAGPTIDAASLVDDDASEGVGDEAADYGAVRISRVSTALLTTEDLVLQTAIRRTGLQLTAELTEILETMHASKPSDGYRPVAWHSVFWSVTSNYQDVPMALEILDPYCDTDVQLAEHIAQNYTDVLKASRPSIFRRRQRLGEACEERVRDRLLELIA